MPELSLPDEYRSQNDIERAPSHSHLGPKLVQSRSELGPKLAQSWPKVGTKLAACGAKAEWTVWLRCRRAPLGGIIYGGERHL